jgi:hypothetical protein
MLHVLARLGQGVSLYADNAHSVATADVRLVADSNDHLWHPRLHRRMFRGARSAVMAKYSHRSRRI